MAWEYEYDGESGETTIYWDGDEQATIERKITQWRNGHPETEKAREAIAEAIQDAGTPERVRMQFDLNYGFSKRDGDQS